MKTSNGTLIREGLIFGVLAGVIFGVVDVASASAMGVPLLRTMQSYASILLGRGAFAIDSHHIIFMGVVVHLALSAVFGFVYALLNSRVSTERTRSYAWEAGMGLLFGVALWAINYQVIARFAYPWFLDTEQFWRAALVASSYGLPLGLMLAASERRVGGDATLTEQWA